MVSEEKVKKWFYHVIIAIDQLFNAITGGAAKHCQAVLIEAQYYRSILANDGV